MKWDTHLWMLLCSRLVVPCGRLPVVLVNRNHLGFVFATHHRPDHHYEADLASLTLLIITDDDYHGQHVHCPAQLAERAVLRQRARSDAGWAAECW